MRVSFFLKAFCSCLLLGLLFSCSAQSKTAAHAPGDSITPAAARPELYLPLLKGKKVAVFANQTSVVGQEYLVDVLKKAGVNIKIIFGPEHGFRGTAEAGAKVESGVDKSTGIRVVSLYGKKKKPSKEDVQGVDVMLFDIQDVGVRFYTYISSLQDYMEAAIHYNIPLVVLDRPNPNGFYVDGPVLEERFKSFIGMQPVPVVYGMTMGEYAKMLLEEGWLRKEAMDAYTQNVLAAIYPPGAKYFSLTVIPCGNYTHKSRYTLPVAPSPNLPEMQSVYWYPSTCFFEGTVISEGRGTDKPFQIFGHPALPKNLYSFTPAPRDYAKEYKPYGKVCYGWNLSDTPDVVLKKINGRLQLQYLLQAYQLFPDKSQFFYTSKKESPGPDDYFFNKLAGTATLMQQMQEGKTEDQIRQSWQPALQAFKAIRKKYLLYPDFE